MGESGALTLVSSNPHKAAEAARIFGRRISAVSLPLPEIQAATLEDITRSKLQAARNVGFDRVVVEDVALGLHELGGFPGPYIRWLLEAAGGAGLGMIASALRDRRAVAQCCVGYWDGTEVHLFLGECIGEVLIEPRGEHGFGWDAWFRPSGSPRTFAEMTAEEKDRISHRGHAYRQLAAYLDR